MINTSPPPSILKPSGGMYRGSDQYDLVNNVITQVQLQNIHTGFEDGIEDTGNYRIFPGVAGLYIITAQVCFLQILADKKYEVLVRISGSTKANSYGQSSLASNLSVPTCCLRWLSNSDYVELFVRSLQGDNDADVTGGEGKTFLFVQRFR